MKANFFILCALGLWFSTASFAFEVPLEIETEYGKIRGKRELDPKVVAFYTVPFATPPTGNMRFRPPVPPSPWKDTRDCTHEEYSHICPQFAGDIMFGQEDCLYMNIYIPDIDITEPLSVMFWIYGGGFSIGDGYEAGWYNGKDLAAKRGVIVVEHNYRLQTLGFLSLPELLAESGSSGNYGVLDQLLALNFTHNNIAQFGGNPDKIAIFGESAGGFSVCWHLVNPSSAGLFSAAIMESGSCTSHEFFIALNRSYEFGQEVVNATKCDSSTDVLSCLRGKDVRELRMWKYWPLQNSTIVPPLAPLMPWGPAIDGTTLPARPIDLINEGKFTRVPLILGTNLNEGTIFVPAMYSVIKDLPIPLNEEGFMKALLHFFNDTAAEAIDSFYPLSQFKNYEDRMAFILRDYFFLCGSRQSARAISGFGVPTYLYQFTLPLPLWVDYDLFGDYHTIELSFVFSKAWPDFIHFFDDKDWYVSDAMTLYWTNMPKYGSPNFGLPSGQPVWPVYNATTDYNIEFLDPLAINQYLESPRCDFWETIEPYY